MRAGSPRPRRASFIRTSSVASPSWKTRHASLPPASAQVRLHHDLLAGRGDGARRTGIDAARAAQLARTPVGADALVIGDEAGRLEFAHQRLQLCRSQRLLERIGAWREIPLRQMRYAQPRLSRQVEDQIEALAACAIRALEIDGADPGAGLDALPVRAALVHVDLVCIVDRRFRAGGEAGVAARAQVQV